MFGLVRKKLSLVGLDISSSAVKLLELSESGGRSERPYRVESYAVEPLSLNAVIEKKIADIEAVGETIKRAVQSSGTKAKRAAVAVSGSAIITKIISLPASLSPQEMEAQINLEADQYIPYALDEVNLDFSVLGPSKKSPDLVDVLLAASRRENLDDRIAALNIAGLTPAVVDVEAYALGNACEALLLGTRHSAQRDEVVAIADIGANTTAVHVLDDGRVAYSREQNFGGSQLTDEIQRRYKLSAAEAGIAKRKGGLPSSYKADVLDPFMEAVAQQITRALQFFYSASAQKRIGLMIVAGGNANIPDIDKVIAERVNAKTIIAQPFANMSAASRVDTKALFSDGPSMMVAAGLALRGFD